MLKLESVKAGAKQCDLETFLKENPFPVLVARKLLGGLLRENRPDPQKVMEARMANVPHVPGTMLHVDQMMLPEELDPQEAGMMATRPLESQFVFELNVMGRGSNLITIGRTAASDVVLNDYTISKRHAQISFDATTRRFQLADTGSTNGTMVGTVQLETNQEISIVSGYWLTFGRLICQFYTPKALHELLQQ